MGVRLKEVQDTVQRIGGMDEGRVLREHQSFKKSLKDNGSLTQKS